MNTFWIMGNGFTSKVATNKNLREYSDHLLEKVKNNEPLLFKVHENNAYILFYAGPGNHVTIMDEKTYDAFRREQMFAAQKAALGSQGGIA